MGLNSFSPRTPPLLSPVVWPFVQIANQIFSSITKTRDKKIPIKYATHTPRLLYAICRASRSFTAHVRRPAHVHFDQIYDTHARFYIKSGNVNFFAGYIIRLGLVRVVIYPARRTGCRMIIAVDRNTGRLSYRSDDRKIESQTNVWGKFYFVREVYEIFLRRCSVLNRRKKNDNTNAASARTIYDSTRFRTWFISVLR